MAAGRRLLIPLVLIGALVAGGCGEGRDLTSASPGDEENGRAVFAASCQSCHGAGAAGTAQGPPLVDRIYEPSHHGDASFILAVRRGSPAHHWDFGDMPPVEGITDQQIADVTAYVRELQRQAGIR